MNGFWCGNLIAIQESTVAALSILNEILIVFFGDDKVKARNRLIATNDDIVQIVSANFASRCCDRNFPIGDKVDEKGCGGVVWIVIRVIAFDLQAFRRHETADV